MGVAPSTLANTSSKKPHVDTHQHDASASDEPTDISTLNESASASSISNDDDSDDDVNAKVGPSSPVTIMDTLAYLEKRNKLLRVMFTTSTSSTTSKQDGEMEFIVPAALLAQREREMETMAKANNMSAGMWSGSLLGRKIHGLIGEIALKAADAATSKNKHDYGDDGFYSCTALEMPCNDEDGASVDDLPDAEDATYTFVLDPEAECASSSATACPCKLVWSPALTEAVRSYYNTGSVNVSDDCQGNDVLFALAYFGIVYSPDQLAFETFASYLRVKLWSDYFNARGSLATWVTKHIMAGRSKLSYSFVTCPEADEGPFYIGTKRLDVFDGGLGDAKSEDVVVTKSYSVVHDLFNDFDDSPEALDGSVASSSKHARTDALIRSDFCSYLESYLPGTDITFSLRKITRGVPDRSRTSTLSGQCISTLAVLHIDFSGKNKKTKNKDSSKASAGSPRVMIKDRILLKNKIEVSGTAVEQAEAVDQPGDDAVAYDRLDDEASQELPIAPTTSVVDPTVVDLDEDDTVDVPLRQVNSGDDVEDKSVVSALSAPTAGGSILTTTDDPAQSNAACRTLPNPVGVPPNSSLPPVGISPHTTPPSASSGGDVLDVFQAMRQSVNALVYGEEKEGPFYEHLDEYEKKEDATTPKYANTGPQQSPNCVTLEDLNAAWLLDCINPFSEFVESTAQACQEGGGDCNMKNAVVSSPPTPTVQAHSPPQPPPPPPKAIDPAAVAVSGSPTLAPQGAAKPREDQNTSSPASSSPVITSGTCPAANVSPASVAAMSLAAQHDECIEVTQIPSKSRVKVLKNVFKKKSKKDGA